MTSEARKNHLTLARESKKLKRESYLNGLDDGTVSDSESYDSSQTEIEEENEMELLNETFGTNYENGQYYVVNELNDDRDRGQPRKSYSEQKYKDKIRLDSWNFLIEKALNPDSAEKLIFDILRVYRPAAYEKISTFTNLVNNIESVFTVYNEAIRGTKKGSSIATDHKRNVHQRGKQSHEIFTTNDQLD